MTASLKKTPGKRELERKGKILPAGFSFSLNIR